MEWAVHVRNPALADRWNDLLADPLRFCEPHLRDLQGPAAAFFREAARQEAPRRACVGNEFCESLLPSLDSFSELCEKLWVRGLEVSFLTPPATDEGLDSLRALFAWLARQGRPTEVVFNDWGVLQLVHTEFPALRPVRGRLLNKTMRDPRVVPLYNAANAPAGIRASMQPAGLDTPFLRSLISNFGVATVEMDLLPNSADLDFRELPFQVACYVPCGFVTSGRHCMISSLHIEEGSRRFRPGVPCRQECREYSTTHTFSAAALPTDGTRFFQRGNTFFYYLDEKALRGFLDSAAERGVARLIYEPGLPM